MTRRWEQLKSKGLLSQELNSVKEEQNKKRLNFLSLALQAGSFIQVFSGL